MSLLVSPMIARIEAPPITEAMTWVRPGERNRVLLNLCQAVPSYAPAEKLQAEIARLALDPEIHLYTDINGIPELRLAGPTYGGGLSRHSESGKCEHNVGLQSGFLCGHHGGSPAR